MTDKQKKLDACVNHKVTLTFVSKDSVLDEVKIKGFFSYSDRPNAGKYSIVDDATGLTFYVNAFEVLDIECTSVELDNDIYKRFTEVNGSFCDTCQAVDKCTIECKYEKAYQRLKELENRIDDKSLEVEVKGLDYRPTVGQHVNKYLVCTCNSCFASYRVNMAVLPYGYIRNNIDSAIELVCPICGTKYMVANKDISRIKGGLDVQVVLND